MKEPRVEDLKIDLPETSRIRKSMANRKSVKITINIDADSLAILRRLATETSVPYQRLLNQILKNGLQKQSSTESRLQRLEKELAAMKRKIAA